MGNEAEKLNGPVGREFIDAIRDRFPDLKYASIQEISEYMSRYDERQIEGVLSNIKGRLFERLVALAENTDNDNWFCRLHEDQFNPSTDLVMINEETGEMLEISLKATDSASYIEAALAKYPDDPILTTEELADRFDDDPRVMVSSFSNEYLVEVTDENFDELMRTKSAWEINRSAIATGTAISASLSIWPFVAAYLRRKISREQFEKACITVLGNSGLKLAGKIITAAAIGPLYPWYVLARMSMGLTKLATR